MQPGDGQHAGDDLLELYALNRLREPELSSFEEHLLVCPDCQDRLGQTDIYVRAMRTAAAKLNKEDKIGRAERARGLAGALAALRPAAVVVAIAALVLGLYWLAGAWRPSGEAMPAVAVVLQAVRGSAEVEARAPAGRPLRLEIDLTGLAAQPSYGLEIAGPGGDIVWKTSAAAGQGKLALEATPSLGAGRYWVRIYSSSSPNELLREYGLKVE